MQHLHQGMRCCCRFVVNRRYFVLSSPGHDLQVVLAEMTLSRSTALTVSVSHLLKLSSNQERTAFISKVHKGGRVVLRPEID